MSHEKLIAEARRIVELTGVRQSTILIDRLADALEAADDALRDWEENGAPAWVAAKERQIKQARETAWHDGFMHCANWWEIHHANSVVDEFNPYKEDA